MAIARSNRIRLVYTAVTVAASAIVIGSGGAVSAASHAANVGQAPTRVGRERRLMAGAQLRPLEFPRHDPDTYQLADGREAEGEVALHGRCADTATIASSGGSSPLATRRTHRSRCPGGWQTRT
jgi:hypothetical protein